MRTITLDVPDELADRLAEVQDRLPKLLTLSLEQPAVPAHVYRAILTFLTSAPTPAQIAAFAPPPEVLERLQALLERERAGPLALSDRAELDELEHIEHLVVMLKAGALSALTGAR